MMRWPTRRPSVGVVGRERVVELPELGDVVEEPAEQEQVAVEHRMIVFREPVEDAGDRDHVLDETAAIGVVHGLGRRGPGDIFDETSSSVWTCSASSRLNGFSMDRARLEQLTEEPVDIAARLGDELVPPRPGPPEPA